MSLLGEAIGFSILGILILVNRHQADLNGFSGAARLRWHQRSFSGHDFPCCRLRPLELLRQASGHAAGQASVRSFRFRQTQPSHSNRSIGCIGRELGAILAEPGERVLVRN